MAQLTKFLHINGSYLFGLRNTQMRSGPTKLTHNSGWYNKAGEKLGWGDLSVADLIRIRDQIEPGELFIVLPAHDSRYPRSKKIDPVLPGRAYVAKHCQYIITHGYIYQVYDDTIATWDIGGITPTPLSRKAAQRLIYPLRVRIQYFFTKLLP